MIKTEQQLDEQEHEKEEEIKGISMHSLFKDQNLICSKQTNGRNKKKKLTFKVYVGADVADVINVSYCHRPQKGESTM